MTSASSEFAPLPGGKKPSWGGYIPQFLGFDICQEMKAVLTSDAEYLSLPSGTILRVRSKKAPLASVMAGSCYVDPLLADLQLLGELEAGADEADIAALAARIFLSELQRTVAKHGLSRRYERSTAVSASIRGRINFPKLVRRAGDASKVPCESWERRARSPAMRMLSAALSCIRRDPVTGGAVPAVLNALLVAFADVLPEVDAALLEGRRLLERNERPFSAAVALARLIIRNAGLAEGSDYHGIAYLVGLDLLFERAVMRALRENGSRFTWSSSMCAEGASRPGGLRRARLQLASAGQSRDGFVLGSTRVRRS